MKGALIFNCFHLLMLVFSTKEDMTSHMNSKSNNSLPAVDYLQLLLLSLDLETQQPLSLCCFLVSYPVIGT